MCLAAERSANGNALVNGGSADKHAQAPSEARHGDGTHDMLHAEVSAISWNPRSVGHLVEPEKCWPSRGTRSHRRLRGLQAAPQAAGIRALVRRWQPWGVELEPGPGHVSHRLRHLLLGRNQGAKGVVLSSVANHRVALKNAEVSGKTVLSGWTTSA
jgi:hypothetical protein